ncbi:hypothetical protein MMC31_003731 [Peltigera leucophlebia]|nr:hypothetical protein [Peltigera leucophlebia]
MDFAPYQDTAPESTRELSPPPQRRSPTPNPRPAPPGSRPLPSSKDSAFTPAPSLPPPSHFTDDETPHLAAGLEAGDVESGRLHVNLFETSLPMRLDYEAMVAYLLLPPAGGVLLLLMEHKSDYVRFHAWQSSLLFTFVFVIHLIFSWSAFISWTLLVIDIAVIALLSLHAYQDADTLDRFEVPFFGGLASSFVDSE